MHKLNNYKLCGLDLVLNELLKHFGDCLISVYVELLNVVLKYGHIPKDWAMGMILLTYEKYGSRN